MNGSSSTNSLLALDAVASCLAVCRSGVRQTARPHGTELLDREPTPDGLVKFHTARKLTHETRFVSRAIAHGHWESPEDYRQGLLPLIVPLTLHKHHLSRYSVPE
jgi:hypothetical protein